MKSKRRDHPIVKLLPYSKHMVYGLFTCRTLLQVVEIYNFDWIAATAVKDKNNTIFASSNFKI